MKNNKPKNTLEELTAWMSLSPLKRIEYIKKAESKRGKHYKTLKAAFSAGVREMINA